MADGTNPAERAEREHLAVAVEQARKELLESNLWNSDTSPDDRERLLNDFLNGQGDEKALKDATQYFGGPEWFDEELAKLQTLMKESGELQAAPETAPTESIDERIKRTEAEFESKLKETTASDVFDDQAKDKRKALLDALAGKTVKDVRLSKHLLASGRSRADFDALIDTLRPFKDALDKANDEKNQLEKKEREAAAVLKKEKAKQAAADAVAAEKARVEAKRVARDTYRASPEGQKEQQAKVLYAAIENAPTWPALRLVGNDIEANEYEKDLREAFEEKRRTFADKEDKAFGKTIGDAIANDSLFDPNTTWQQRREVIQTLLEADPSERHGVLQAAKAAGLIAGEVDDVESILGRLAPI